MSNGHHDDPPDLERRSREPLTRSHLSVPTSRLTLKPRTVVTADTRPKIEAPRSRPARGGIAIGYQAVKAELHQRLLDQFDEENLMTASEEFVAAAVREFVEGVLATEDLPLNDQERKRLADDLTEETLGVGPLAPLMADPAVTDILVNRHDQVYIERFGKLDARPMSASATTTTWCGSSSGSPRGSAGGSTKLADGRRPAARRQPRQRHAPAGDARRPDALDPPLRPPAAAARGPAASWACSRRT